MRDQRVSMRIGNMAMGMKDPGGDFDQFFGDDLALSGKIQPYRLFNHA